MIPKHFAQSSKWLSPNVQHPLRNTRKAFSFTLSNNLALRLRVMVLKTTQMKRLWIVTNDLWNIKSFHKQTKNHFLILCMLPAVKKTTQLRFGIRFFSITFKSSNSKRNFLMQSPLGRLFDFPLCHCLAEAPNSTYNRKLLLRKLFEFQRHDNRKFIIRIELCVIKLVLVSCPFDGVTQI